jgi:hypothetical protein
MYESIRARKASSWDALVGMISVVVSDGNGWKELLSVSSVANDCWYGSLNLEEWGEMCEECPFCTKLWACCPVSTIRRVPAATAPNKANTAPQRNTACSSPLKIGPASRATNN